VGRLSLMRIENTVFISYRRTNVPWALAIFKELTAHGYDVFFDFTGIASGDFERVITANIRARAHFLVLLTPSALESYHRPGDWMRREVETALEARRNIIPLMLEDFDFSSPGIEGQLSESMVTLKRYNALRVPVDYFDAAMRRLRERFLNVPLDAVLHPVSSAVQQAARDQQQAAVVAPAVEQRDLTALEYFEQAVNKGYTAEAILLYSHAIRLKPDYAHAFYNRSLVRYRLGDVDGARDDGDTAIRLMPGHAYAFYNRAVFRSAQGDVDGARDDYDTAIRLNPDLAEAFFNRSLLRSAQGDAAGARDDCETAIRLEPDDADALHHRALLRKEQGDFAGARQDYDTAIRLKPDFAVALYNRGILRMEQGDFARARKDYDAAIRFKPDYADAFDNRGHVRIELGDRVGAQQDFDMAKRLRDGR
jgi:tetratricopeptide (TPR) repeat protein